MADQTNIEITLQAWADIVIEKWEVMVARLNVRHTGALLNSFVHHVNTQSGGDSARIEFLFQYYGKFVDMGVGRGVSIGQVEFSNRKRKPWYSKTFFSQVKRLGDILSEKYVEKGKLSIIENIEGNGN